MGYIWEMFEEIDTLALRKGGHVLDLGSQDIFVANDHHLRVLNAFIDKYSGIPLSENLIGQSLEVREVWEHAGFHYNCLDVDERPSTLRVDLQNLVFPHAIRGRYDFVGNMGTTEHLASPGLGLALMHYACKPGGWLFSDVPIFGWGNHGLVNLTPKFWHQLQFINGYKVKLCKLRKDQEDEFDAGNFFHADMDYMDGIKTARGISWMFRLVAAKPPQDRAFIPPYDALLPQSDGSKEAAIMLGLLRPYLLAGIWTKREAADAVNDAVGRLGKPYRVQNTAGRSVYQIKMLAKKSPLLRGAVRAARAAIHQAQKASN